LTAKRLIDVVKHTLKSLTKEVAHSKAYELYKDHKAIAKENHETKLYTLSRSVAKMVKLAKSVG
jgi:hypothetical protein